MKYKTLVLKYGTQYQEFVGWENYVGWVTSSKPIHLFDEDITMDDIPDIEEFSNIDDLKLVTIEFKLS